MEEKKNKRKVFAICGIIVLVILLVIIIAISFNAEKRATRKLNSFGKKFYSYYYEERSDKKDVSKVKEFMSQYAEIGFTMKLKDLKVYLDGHKIENYDSLKKCDEDKTKITVYPITPYGKKNFRVETKMECDF